MGKITLYLDGEFEAKVRRQLPERRMNNIQLAIREALRDWLRRQQDENAKVCPVCGSQVLGCEHLNFSPQGKSDLFIIGSGDNLADDVGESVGELRAAALGVIAKVDELDKRIEAQKGKIGIMRSSRDRRTPG